MAGAAQESRGNDGSSAMGKLLTVAANSKMMLLPSPQQQLLKSFKVVLAMMIIKVVRCYTIPRTTRQNR